MALGGRSFRSKKQQLAYDRSFAGRYQKLLSKNPFIFFGLPFCGMMVLGSYWLAGISQVKFDRDDQKVQEMNEEEILKMTHGKREFDIKEEYYRLQGLAEEDWEPKRVERFKGESDNVF